MARHAPAPHAAQLAVGERREQTRGPGTGSAQEDFDRLHARFDAPPARTDASVIAVSDEAALLARARDGDLDAFAEFVRRFERPIRALLGRLLDDERDIDEAAQDTFVQAWRHLDRFRGEAAPFTWLYRIAVNEALQRTRRKRLEVGELDEAAALGADAGGRAPPPGLPEQAAEHRELTEHLMACLRELPFGLRAPLVLRDVEGWSNQEVADALGLSVAAAKSRIHRARMQLRAELEPWLRARERRGRPPER